MSKYEKGRGVSQGIYEGARGRGFLRINTVATI